MKDDSSFYIDMWDRLREGDDEAFSLLFEAYFDLLFRYGTKIISDKDTVKDCIQDLFIKIYQNRKNLSDTQYPKSYLLLALKNMIYDHLSKNKNMVYVLPEELPFDVEYEYDVNDGEELEEVFQKALDQLSSRQKEALYLRYQLDLPYDEISVILNINYQSTRNLIHRSITKVRELLDIQLFLVLFLKYYN